MRTYTSQELKGLSKNKLLHKLAMLDGAICSTSEDKKMQKTNRAMLELALNNGVRHPIDEVMQDIKAGAADIDDMELR